jgi:hypothetical protein
MAEKDRSNKVQNVTQIVLAVLTFLTLLSYIIFSAIQNQKTRKAIERADTANYYAQKAMDYSKDAVDLSKQVFGYTKSSDCLNDIRLTQDIRSRERNTKRELRAYVMVSIITKHVFEQDKEFTYILKIKNTGRTPASKIVYRNGIKIGGTGINDNEISRLETQKQDVDVLGSELELGCLVNTGRILDPVIYNDIVNGKRKIFIIGSIIYEDIFKETHRTRYCRIYSVSDNDFPGYGKYNDAY